MLDICPRWDVIVRIQELGNTPTTQRLDPYKHFFGEFLGVVGNEVGLDFCRTGPCDIAEWTSSPGHVYVLHVSVELLDTSEVFSTICTDRPRPETHGTRALVLCSTFDGYWT